MFKNYSEKGITDALQRRDILNSDFKRDEVLCAEISSFTMPTFKNTIEFYPDHWNFSIKTCLNSMYDVLCICRGIKPDGDISAIAQSILNYQCIDEDKWETALLRRDGSVLLAGASEFYVVKKNDKVEFQIRGVTVFSIDFLLKNGISRILYALDKAKTIEGSRDEVRTSIQYIHKNINEPLITGRQIAEFDF